METQPDGTDELWQEISEMNESANNCGDSGLGSSLISPVKPPSPQQHLEPGEIVDSEAEGQDEATKSSSQSVQDDPDDDPEYRHNKWKFYVSGSWPERLVLENPPAPVVKRCKLPPEMCMTLITDCVGTRLTTRDRTICMQNDVASDFWELARRIARDEVNVQFRYVVVQVGLDWCLNAKKNLVREAVGRLIFAVQKKNPRAGLGIVGITPHFHDLVNTKKFTVNFNRNVASAIKDFGRREAVQFLPLHLHFLEQDGSPLQPVARYFDSTDCLYIGRRLGFERDVAQGDRVDPLGWTVLVVLAG